MILRNLLFLGLIAVGIISIGAYLFPEEVPPHAVNFDPAQYEQPGFQGVVEEVNTAFRTEWKEMDAHPVGQAPPLQLARRLSLALTGSTPSLQEIRQFEAYAGDDRMQWWLAGLLEDRRYSDYWAERFARAYVGTENGPFVFFRRRRFVLWLSDQLLAQRPYDEIVRELIAAQGLWTDKPATNFISVTIEPDKQKGPDPERLAGRVTRAFLGLRLDCAQCHNHPFQEWKQDDFQGLAAYFAQTHHGFTGIYDGEGQHEIENRKTKAKDLITPHVPFNPELVPSEGTRRQRLAAWVTADKNPWFAKATVNRVWALLFGKPLVDPVDDLTQATYHPAALQILADDFVAHDYDLQRLIQIIAATEVFQLDSAGERVSVADERAWAVFPLTRLRPEQTVKSVLQSASLQTINSDSHVVWQFFNAIGINDFVTRYGDTGEDEFDSRAGTIPQRLLLMNGELVKEKTKEQIFNAATQTSWLAPDDRTAVETAFLTVLTRRPTPEEAAHFEAIIAQRKGGDRARHLEDLYWTLLNTTEFAWNH